MQRTVAYFFLTVTLLAADSRIIPGVNAFTTATYQQVAHGDTNLILSPFNIAAALSMVLGGARGATASEIASVLHQHFDASYDSAFAEVTAALAQTGTVDGNELLIANGLWVQKGLPIQPAFQKTLANHYHAPLTLLDFAANPEGARGEINRWTEQHTKEKIKNLLPPGSVSADTPVVLTSAIYFYGRWQETFVASRTQPAPFTLETGATVQTNFMNQTHRFGYGENSSMQLLEMRYAGTGIAFDVLLPKTPKGLADLEKSITPQNFSSWFGNLDSRSVQVNIPKFRAESQFSLRETLSAMGMPVAFSRNADFSGIDGGAGKLGISELVHKAFVDVSERGTEAAAATGITMTPTAMPAETPVVFRADHPFLFMIRDTRTGLILFIGRLKHPRS